MRPVSHRLAVAALALLAGACAVPFEVKVLAEHPNFATPENTGRSFLAALSVEEPTAEYRCFSYEMKQDFGATLDAYLLYRVELAEEFGAAIRLAHRLSHLESAPAPDGVRTVWGTGGGPRLVLVMKRQHYFQFYGSGGQEVGDFLEGEFTEFLSWEDGRVVFDAPLENRAVRAALNRWKPEDFHRFEAGSEWKILRVEDPSAPPGA